MGDALRECTRWHRHEEHPILHEFGPAMLGEHGIDDRRPELSNLVDHAQVDLLQTTGDGVQKIAESFGLVPSVVHGSTFVRSTTAAGLMALGSGDAVVTRV